MKKILIFILKLLVSGTLLLYLFHFSGINVQRVIKTLKHTQLSIFIVAFFVYLCIIFISTKRWSLFLPETIKYSRLVSLYFIGSFFNTFLPGLVGGDAVKAFYLYKHTGKGGASLASIFMDRYMGLTAMAFIGLIAFVVGYTYIKGSEIIWVLPVFCGGFLLASLILWRINWGKIKFLSSFYTPLMEYKTRKKVIYKGLLLGFIVQCVSIITSYVLSLSIGLKAPIIYFFIFIPIITAASAIPLSVAGLGIREAGYVILFTKVGVASSEALSLSLLLFTVMCMVNLIGGIEYLRIGKPPKKIADEHR